MNEPIHKRALRSAAKVAIVLGLAGCTASHTDRGEVDSGAAGDGGASLADAAPSRDAASPDAGPVACTVDVDPVSREARADGAALACCGAHLAGVLDRMAGDPVPYEIPAADRASPSTRECCEGLMYDTFSAEVRAFANAVSAASPGADTWRLTQACCASGLVPVEDPSGVWAPGCTPWGPPVPPALDEELEYLDALA